VTRHPEKSHQDGQGMRENEQMCRACFPEKQKLERAQGVCMGTGTLGSKTQLLFSNTWKHMGKPCCVLEATTGTGSMGHSRELILPQRLPSSAFVVRQDPIIISGQWATRGREECHFQTRWGSHVRCYYCSTAYPNLTDLRRFWNPKLPPTHFLDQFKQVVYYFCSLVLEVPNEKLDLEYVIEILYLIE
jgi:hypothetical protein